VGESAIQSLKTDVSQSNFLCKPYDFDLEEHFWHQKIYIAIMYFKYMVNETIHNSGHVIWSPYFNSFTEELINLIPERDDNTTILFAHHLITEQNSIMESWLDLAKELNVEHRIIDTVKCLGKNIISICEADRRKISEQFAKEQIKSIVHYYFALSNRPNNNENAVQRILEWIEKILVNPKNSNDVNPIRESVYQDYLLDVWGNFDKLPYQDSGLIGRFKENVITKYIA
jgi:hypothetical protein